MQRILEAPHPPRVINPKTHSPIPMGAGDSVRSDTGFGLSSIPVVAKHASSRSSWHSDDDNRGRHGRAPDPWDRRYDQAAQSKPRSYTSPSPSTHSGVMSVNGDRLHPWMGQRQTAQPDTHAVHRRQQPGSTAHPGAQNHWGAPGFHEKPPGCAILASTDRREVALWRKLLQVFEEALYDYNLRHRCNYNPPLRLFVHPSTWATIGEQLLNPEHLTEMGKPTNDWAIEDYLRGTGDYADTHGKPGELYCSEPLEEYRNLRWPNQPGLSFVTAFDIYVDLWREVTASLPDVDTPTDAELAPIMRAAIMPEWLRKTIERKISSGKGPELVGHTTQWRKRANENLRILMTVIRENAHMAQLLRKSDALHLWSGGASQQQHTNGQDARPGTTHAAPAKQTARQPVTLSELHLQRASLTTRNPDGGKGMYMNPGGGSITSSHGTLGGGGSASGGGGAPPQKGSQDPAPEAPICPHPGCSRKLKKMQNGNFFRTCYDHSPQGLAAAKAAEGGTAPVRTCILEGCTKPRALSTNGKNYLACCREHYLKYRAAQQKASEDNPEAPPGSGGPAPVHKPKCYLCNGEHRVSMCPKLTAERRQELTDNLQMTADVLWCQSHCARGSAANRSRDEV